MPRYARSALFISFVGLSALPACNSAEEISPAPTYSKGQKPKASPPANVVGGFSIQVPEVTLAPGEESEPCYILPLELTGPSHIVGGGKLTTPLGLHHGNITTRKKTGEGFRLCPEDEHRNPANDVIEGGAVLFGSSTQISGEEWQSFPDGMGFPVQDGYEVVARMHYLNTSLEPITLAPRYEWYTIDEASVEHLLAPFFLSLKGFEIAPQSELTAVGGCRIPEPMHVVNVLPHMHRLGVEFTMEFMGGTFDGQKFLESKGYDPDNGVMVQYDPGIDLSQGDGLRFSCKWHNTMNKTIVEGVGDNEMCMAFGYAWPYETTYTGLAEGPDQCLVLKLPELK